MSKIVKISLILAIILFSIFSHVLSNSWILLTDSSNFIPENSNIFTFSPTVIDEGSGGYWRYGEDHKNYYYFDLEHAHVSYAMPKTQACPHFKADDFSTWCQVTKYIKE